MEQNKIKHALLLRVDAEILEYDASQALVADHKFSRRYNKHKRRIIHQAEGQFNNCREIKISNPGKHLRRTVALIAAIVIILGAASTVVAVVKPEIFYEIKEKVTNWHILFDRNVDEKESDFEYLSPPVPNDYRIVDETS